MLKIQPIAEHNELHDDIRKFNLAQTVQIDAPGSIQKGDDDNVSEVTADDNDDGTLERMDSTEGGIMGGEENGDAQFDFLDISNIHNNETPTTTLATSTGTFLPQPILLDDDHDDNALMRMRPAGPLLSKRSTSRTVSE